MVKINSIDITPPLINSSCAWSSTLEQLQELYKCPYTGGVVTRTATTEGFKEDDTHTVGFRLCIIIPVTPVKHLFQGQIPQRAP